MKAGTRSDLTIHFVTLAGNEAISPEVILIQLPFRHALSPDAL
jgi:hypothetical protein